MESQVIFFLLLLQSYSLMYGNIGLFFCPVSHPSPVSEPGSEGGFFLLKASFTMTAGIGSSPSATLNIISEKNGWMEVSTVVNYIVNNYVVMNFTHS